MAEAWLDVTLIQCPNCGEYYVDASWYAISIGSDIECGKCGETFNTKRNAKDRILLRFLLAEDKIMAVEINKRLSVEEA